MSSTEKKMFCILIVGAVAGSAIGITIMNAFASVLK